LCAKNVSLLQCCPHTQVAALSLSTRLPPARSRTRDTADHLDGSNGGTGGSPTVCQSQASQILGNAARRRNW
jgi:hypothetical protein